MKKGRGEGGAFVTFLMNSKGFLGRRGEFLIQCLNLFATARSILIGSLNLGYQLVYSMTLFTFFTDPIKQFILGGYLR